MKKVTLIIPAYNEEKRIEAAASALFSDSLLKKECRLIFIVDGNDRTAEILEGMEWDGADAQIKKYPRRLGKGGAVFEGIKEASTEYVGFVDVERRMAVGRIGEIAGMISGKKLDCVIGKRLRMEGAPVMRVIGTRAFNIIVNLLFGFGISDTQCGCKFFRKDLVYSKGAPLKIRGFAFDVELLGRVLENGGKITEYEYAGKWGETGGFSLLESPRMLFDLIRIRFF